MQNPMDNLSRDEIIEYSNLSRRLANWIAYLDQHREETKLARKEKRSPPDPLDMNKNLKDEQYFRMDALAQKIWGG